MQRFDPLAKLPVEDLEVVRVRSQGSEFFERFPLGESGASGAVAVFRDITLEKEASARLLVSEHGRDDLGLHRPPEEVNLVRTRGPARWYGFPECWGQGGRACRAAAEVLHQTASDLGRRAAELRRSPGRGHGGDDFSKTLTPRQLEILALVAEGLSNAEIASRLYLTESTVKWHVRKILRALGVSNRAQAVARYLGMRR